MYGVLVVYPTFECDKSKKTKFKRLADRVCKLSRPNTKPAATKNMPMPNEKESEQMTMSQNSWNQIFQFGETITARTATRKNWPNTETDRIFVSRWWLDCRGALVLRVKLMPFFFVSFGLREIDKKPNGIVHRIASKAAQNDDGAQRCGSQTLHGFS